MCAISGFFNPDKDFTEERDASMRLLENMNRAQKRRGPDDEGTFLSPHFGLAQVRLSMGDLVTGHQPMIRRAGEQTAGIV